MEELSILRTFAAATTVLAAALVAVAIGEGAQAAVAINKAFLRRDGFCD